MVWFKGRSSLLEVQNRALIKTARERAAQIEKLEAELQSLRQQPRQPDDGERELQTLREKAEQQIEKLQRELQAAQQRAEQQSSEIERLTRERDFYSKRALALEEENRELTESLPNIPHRPRSSSAN
jgi:chromosome segregation ATPase